MTTDKIEKDELTNEHFPLADTPEGRKEQYEKAVEIIEQFQNQHSPKFTDYTEDLTKVTVWDDEYGKRHYESEELTIQEKETLDDAMEIISIYEDHNHDEYFEVETRLPHEPQLTNRIVEDIQNIRDRNEGAPSRLQSFLTNNDQPLPESLEKELPNEPELDR